ncbi:NAD(P)-binding protein [Pyruvatibacter mobilis]|uniref:NAD(P)-binding protein n=1 Tax=Pyruvatibacter mobilis TaxID=1712261 RepID=UPI003BACB144
MGGIRLERGGRGRGGSSAQGSRIGSGCSGHLAAVLLAQGTETGGRVGALEAAAQPAGDAAFERAEGTVHDRVPRPDPLHQPAHEL